MARDIFERRTFRAAPEGIVEVFVDARFMQINALPCEEDNLTIDYCVSDEYPYQVRLEGGIVMLDCPRRERAEGLSGFVDRMVSAFMTRTPATIEIRVPRGYMGMLNLCTSNAQISVSDLELHSRLHAFTRMGRIEVRGVIATAFELNTSNGIILAENAAACGEVDDMGEIKPAFNKLGSSNGSIELRGFSTLGDLNCTTSNGSLRMSDTAVQGRLEARTSNAALRLDNVSAQESASFKTSNAAIQCKNLLARDIELHTSNAQIRGTIVGRAADFAISCSTSNGRCTPASSNSGAGRALNAHTSNANIALDFVN